MTTREQATEGVRRCTEAILQTRKKTEVTDSRVALNHDSYRPVTCVFGSLALVFGVDQVPLSQADRLGNPSCFVQTLDGLIKANDVIELTPDSSSDFISLLEKDGTRGAIVYQRNVKGNVSHLRSDPIMADAS